MTSTFKSFWQKLRDKTYREYFVEADVKRGIPFQMRALLKKKGWSQQQLAAHSGLTQGAVSRALNPNYGNLSLNTIIRIAAGFDVAFLGVFVPFSELVRKHERLSEEESANLASFNEEDAFLEESVPDVVTLATSAHGTTTVHAPSSGDVRTVPLRMASAQLTSLRTTKATAIELKEVTKNG